MNLKLVIAGSFSEYQLWIANFGEKKANYRYCRYTAQLVGVDKESEVILVGSYWNNPLLGTKELAMFRNIRKGESNGLK